MVSRAHARGLEAEQLLLDKTDILKDDVSKYNALYTKVRRDAEVDPERTFAENWTAITLLATFIDDAVESAKDQDIADLVVSPEKVAGDLNDILYDYGRAYPTLPCPGPCSRGGQGHLHAQGRGKGLFGSPGHWPIRDTEGPGRRDCPICQRPSDYTGKPERACGNNLLG